MPVRYPPGALGRFFLREGKANVSRCPCIGIAAVIIGPNGVVSAQSY